MIILKSLLFTFALIMSTGTFAQDYTIIGDLIFSSKLPNAEAGKNFCISFDDENIQAPKGQMMRRAIFSLGADTYSKFLNSFPEEPIIASFYSSTEAFKYRNRSVKRFPVSQQRSFNGVAVCIGGKYLSDKTS